MFKFKIFSAILILVFLSGCGWPWSKKNSSTHQPEYESKQVAELVETTPDNQPLFWPYSNPKHGYKLEYPVETWFLNKADSNNVEIIYQGQNDKVRLDVPGKLMISIETTDKTSLEEVIFEEALNENSINYIQKGDISLASVEIPEGGIQILALKDGKIYKITQMIELEVLSDDILFQSIKSDLERMIESFSFN